MQRYSTFLTSSDNQFGFKKKSGCVHAIYTLKCIVDYYASNNSTVNLCALDLSKAFDKMNHHALFSKLMKRHIPVSILRILEIWFQSSITCVKWGNCFSEFFKLTCGIRQGGVLSPHLFAVYIDSVIEKITASEFGCEINWAKVGILVYADDIILLAPSLHSLQSLLRICETELNCLAMTINVSKSACMRVGPDWQNKPTNITTCDGNDILWLPSVRYLGVYIAANRVFRCVFDNAKKSFYRAFNAVFGKIGGRASEEVVLHIMKSKCMPLLLYGLEVCPMKKRQLNSLEFVLTNCFMKIFKTKSKDVVIECMSFFDFPNIGTVVNA